MIVNKLVDTGKLLDAVSVDGAGPIIKFSKYDTLTFHVLGETTPSATVVIDRSVDGTNWIQVSSTAVSAAGVTEVLVKNEVALYYRATVSSYVSGDLTVTWNGA